MENKGNMNKREKVKKPEGSKTHRFLWIGLLIFIALIFACVGFSYRSIRQRLNGVADAAMMETGQDENAGHASDDAGKPF